MTDKYRIDDHKLMYHVGRVNDWLGGHIVYPIYMELSPSGACNHRCTFCGLDFMEYKKRFLDTEILKTRLTEMGQLGVKSIMYGGEGEPFLHPHMSEIINHTKASSIDVAVTTNGVLLTKEIVQASLLNIEWIKFSFNAGTKETYAKIHRTKSGDFDIAINNIAYAVEYKKQHNLKCAIGIQILLLPENSGEILTLAKIAKEIGADYIVVKPYSQHIFSKTVKYSNIKYQDYQHLSSELSKFNSSSFNAIFRTETMKLWDKGERNYECCLANTFWSYIDSGGNVWGCSVYLGDERFNYGNINQSTFKEIWEGSIRMSAVDFIEKELDVSHCRVNCRMDKINRYLWELKNHPEHVNFI
ncbi:MAG: radical SAM protein [Nitrospirae bacterium]|nr:radical SAM protein [Nitrospirota bacterium]